MSQYTIIESGEPNFADWLGHILTSNNLTGDQLAKAIGKSGGAVSHWRHNKRLPDPVSRIKLAAFLSPYLKEDYSKLIREILWRVHVSEVKNSQ